MVKVKVQRIITRKVTDEDIKKYIPMVNNFLRNSVAKNWKESSFNKGQDNISLGNSGYTISDMRQYIMTELVVALQHFDPNYITKEGRTVKESTFVFTHIFNRLGAKLKRLTKKRYGYTIWTQDFDEILSERHENDA